MFIYTSKFFTAGHVPDQRSECSNRSVKNGMKEVLVQSTFKESFDRITSVSCRTNLDCRDELVDMRHEGKRVGRKYSAALLKSKAESTKLSFVETISDTTTKFMVKENKSSGAFCIVDLQCAITWNGQQYCILTSTCAYFTSTRQICPCTCVLAQRSGIDIDAFGQCSSLLVTVESLTLDRGIVRKSPF